MAILNSYVSLPEGILIYEPILIRAVLRSGAGEVPQQGGPDLGRDPGQYTTTWIQSWTADGCESKETPTEANLK